MQPKWYAYAIKGQKLEHFISGCVICWKIKYESWRPACMAREVSHWLKLKTQPCHNWNYQIRLSIQFSMMSFSDTKIRSQGRAANKTISCWATSRKSISASQLDEIKALTKSFEGEKIINFLTNLFISLIIVLLAFQFSYQGNGGWWSSWCLCVGQQISNHKIF